MDVVIVLAVVVGLAYLAYKKGWLDKYLNK